MKRRQNGIVRALRVLVIMLKRTRTPHKLALGFAIGLFFSILPLPFVGMFIALGLAFLLRINIISTYLGTLVVNFATGFFFYLLDYKAGTMIFGTPFIKVLPGDDLLRFALANLRELAVGGLAVATVMSAAAYGIIYGIARLFARKSRQNQ